MLTIVTARRAVRDPLRGPRRRHGRVPAHLRTAAGRRGGRGHARSPRRRAPDLAGSRRRSLNSYAPPPCRSNPPHTCSTRAASTSPCTTGAGVAARRCCSRTRRDSTVASGRRSPRCSSRAGRHVYSFDFRGHGDSDAPPPTSRTTRGAASPTTRSPSPSTSASTGHPHLLACGHSKGGAALLLGEADAPGTYPRHLGVRTDHVPERGAAPAERGVRLGGRGAPPAQRVAVDRGRVRGVRIEAAAERDARRRTARLRGLRPARSRRRRVRAQVPRPRSRRRSTRWRRPTARSGGCRRSSPAVRVVCGETSTDISPRFGEQIVAPTAPRVARGHDRSAATSGRSRTPTTTIASMLQFAAETEAPPTRV